MRIDSNVLRVFLLISIEYSFHYFFIKFVVNKICTIFFETISLKVDISKAIERYRYIRQRNLNVSCARFLSWAPRYWCYRSLSSWETRGKDASPVIPVQAIALLPTLSRRIRINLYLHTSSIIMLIVKQGASIIRFEQTFCFRSWFTWSVLDINTFAWENRRKQSSTLIILFNVINGFVRFIHPWFFFFFFLAELTRFNRFEFR